MCLGLRPTRHKLAQFGFKVNDQLMSSVLPMGLPKLYEPMVMGLKASGIQMRLDTIRAKIQILTWCGLMNPIGNDSGQAILLNASIGQPSYRDNLHVM